MNKEVLLEARQKLAGFLKARRVQLDLTQQELAEKAGVQRSTIVAMEAAAFGPGFDLQMKVAEALCLFPAFVEYESDTPIAKALRENWNPNPEAMPLDEALRLKKNRHKPNGSDN